MAMSSSDEENGVGTGGGIFADINITPLVDVLLVLLIIFMVVVSAAMGQRGYDIEVPKESTQSTPQEQSDTKNIMLAINENDCNAVNPLVNTGSLPPDCRVRVNEDPVALTDLPRKLDEIFKARKKSEKILFLAAQNKMNYEAVVRILDVAKNAVGEDLKIAIVSDEKFAFGSTSK